MIDADELLARVRARRTEDGDIAPPRIEQAALLAAHINEHLNK